MLPASISGATRPQSGLTVLKEIDKVRALILNDTLSKQLFQKSIARSCNRANHVEEGLSKEDVSEATNSSLKPLKEYLEQEKRQMERRNDSVDRRLSRLEEKLDQVLMSTAHSAGPKR